MSVHAMVDLETLGRDERAVVASIGAVVFDPWDVVVRTHAEDLAACPTFYERLRLDRQPTRVFDGSTVSWWLEQSGPARYEITTGAKEPAVVMQTWAAWIDAHNVDYLWSLGGASFDFPILRTLMEDYGYEEFNRKGLLDMRSLLKCAPIARNRRDEGVAHRALDDAMAQARSLRAALARLQVPRW